MSGPLTHLALGNLDARRDWGHAYDYVKAMHAMLQHPEPLDLVAGTGEAHSVRDFLDIAFEHVGLDWSEYVVVDPRFYRPAEVDYLCADITKAREVLGWKPEITFEALVREMVDKDVAAAEIHA